MLRVDHAGEYGAQCIYEGQLAVIKAKNALLNTPNQSNESIIEHMKSTEVAHLRAIESLIPVRAVRPSALLPLWRVAGFGLGAVSALLGDRAAMACTVAVEEVITDHYNDQLRVLANDERLKESEAALRELIKKHRDEEEEHRQIGVKYEAELTPAYGPFTQLIKAGVRAAIYVTQKV